jgi:hypothetical protein
MIVLIVRNGSVEFGLQIINKMCLLVKFLSEFEFS